MITSKFISPGGWFSLEYPAAWSEFEDSEDTFLFYNPERWCGNFRISAYKGAENDYGRQCIEYELKSNRQSTLVTIGVWECAYSVIHFQEEGVQYCTHIWVTGKDKLSFECSFTTALNADRTYAEEIIRTLHVRTGHDFAKREIIPVRIMEIGEINEAFYWVSTTVKKTLNKDFTSSESDIEKIQALIESGKINPNQRTLWEHLGLAFGTIVENEMDGMQWVTVVEGRKEYVALRFKDTSLLIHPSALVWDKVRQNQTCILRTVYNDIKDKVSSDPI